MSDLFKRMSDKLGYHQAADWDLVKSSTTDTQGYQFTYRFENFFHPLVSKLLQQLNTDSLAGVFDPSWQHGLTKDFFTSYYTEPPDENVAFAPFPQKEIDVALGGPYANYNWELLFHIPVTIAVHLSKSQRFAEAREWFHYVFDPTAADGNFWRFLGFLDGPNPPKTIDDLLRSLSATEPDADSLAYQATVLAGLDAIRTSPFQPHAVARTRLASYQYYVVMKYLDNLIDWGDSLFVQDSIETINEATLCYVLASSLLGARPDELSDAATPRAKCFADLRTQGLDPMGNALVDLEAQFPFNVMPAQGTSADDDLSGPLFGLGSSLYFCIPRNDKLLGYWETVEDRLYKIRHCMNIEGVVRPLALFDPPIDPAMLVKAAAAGIDIGSIASASDQPIGPLRSSLLIQKAAELAAEVKALGATLLAALEKSDSERLALLRQTQELKIHALTEETRFLQWKHAQRSTDALLATRAITHARYAYYQRLLGSKVDKDTAPEKLPVQRREMTIENFDEIYADLVDRYAKTIAEIPLPKLRLAGDSSPSTQSGASGAGSLHLSSHEDVELNRLMPQVKQWQAAAFGLKVAAPAMTLLPSEVVDLHYWGLGGSLVFGGLALSKNLITAAEASELLASRAAHDAAMTAKTAGYERRADEWILQNNVAARELMQLGRQLIASIIAEQAAKHEHEAAKKQAAQAAEMREKMESKFTNQKLYAWMQGEISRVYYQFYRFAFDVARRAERTMKRELMRPELDGTDFVQFNYWDGGRKGLLAGESLHLDVRRMEMAYHDSNKRELELTRHVSLRQLDPLALIAMKATGTCSVTIPEWLYDRDCPGHYLRRLKTVAVSIPSVVGPYASVACKVTLVRSSVRVKPDLLETGAYERARDTDSRFIDYVGSVQSIVTSGGSNDSGMFEPNLRDERFLPFEGMGAISTWQLALPSQLRSFDYNTISDVILHVRYTARDGGATLAGPATGALVADLAATDTSSLALLFAPRYDFPTEWAAFQNGASAFTFTLRKDYFPYMVQGSKHLTVSGMELQRVTDGAIVKQAVDAPAAITTGLNGADRAASVSISPGGALTPTATAVYLIVRYTC